MPRQRRPRPLSQLPSRSSATRASTTMVLAGRPHRRRPATQIYTLSSARTAPTLTPLPATRALLLPPSFPLTVTLTPRVLRTGPQICRRTDIRHLRLARLLLLDDANHRNRRLLPTPVCALFASFRPPPLLFHVPFAPPFLFAGRRANASSTSAASTSMAGAPAAAHSTPSAGHSSWRAPATRGRSARARAPSSRRTA